MVPRVLSVIAVDDAASLVQGNRLGRKDARAAERA